MNKAKTWMNPSQSRKPRAHRLTETEAAWLAGLFDGEGTIIFPRSQQANTRKEKVRIAVGMCCRPIIQRLAEVTGVLRIHVKPPQFAHHSVQYIWAATGPNAAFILQQIFPWLIVKREAAEKAIAMYAGNFAAVPCRPNRTDTKTKATA